MNQMSEVQPITILSVDDNDAIRYSFTRYLREGGYEVIEARTGEQALEMARREPALITLDINLPDIDGYEICRRLKNDPATREIPILHISASYVDAIDRARGLEGGADAYLAEPVDRDELLATVKALLRMRQAQLELVARPQKRSARERNWKERTNLWKCVFGSARLNWSARDGKSRTFPVNYCRLKMRNAAAFPANCTTVQGNYWLR